MKTWSILILFSAFFFDSSNVLLAQTNYSQQVSDEQQNTPAAIKKDISALYGPTRDAVNAAQRLVNRGTIVLDMVHHALLDKDVAADKKTRLISVLSSIGDDRSISPIIKVARLSSDEERLNFYVIFHLTQFDQNDEIVQYVSDQLNDASKSQKIHGAALLYFAKQPNKSARHWAEFYSKPGVDAGIKSKALYLGGLLGIIDFKQKIIDALEEKNHKMEEEYELLGLAALTKPDEFKALISHLKLNKDSIALAHQYQSLYMGKESDRKKAAIEMINKGRSYFKIDAINYLIKTGDVEALAGPWLRNNKLVRRLVAKAKLTIVVDAKGPRFERASSKKPQVSVKQIKAGAAMLVDDDYFRKIVDTFKHHDKAEFATIAFLNKDEMARYLLTNDMAVKFYSSKDLDFKGMLLKRRKKILASWDRVYKSGQLDHLNWKIANYIATDVHTVLITQPMSILIGQNGHYYKILVPGVMPFEGKWMLQGQLKWQGEHMNPGEPLQWSVRAAKNNQTTAASELKILNDTGKSGDLPILRMRASYGDHVAEYELYSKLVVSESPAAKHDAREWLIKSALGKYPKAQYDLSEMLMSNWYSAKSIDALKMGRKYLMLSADQKYIYALKKIAEDYSRGSGGFELDTKMAIEYYQALLDLNVQSLSKEDANAYKFFERDIRDAIEKLKHQSKGLQSNDPKVLTETGMQLLANSTAVSQKNGLTMLQKAVDKGYAEAQYQLGLIYVNGNEVAAKDIPRAISLWAKASDSNYIIASKELAYGYLRGKYGIQKNPKAALLLSAKVAAYYKNNPNEDNYSKDYVREWSVLACDTEIDIKMKNDPTFVIPRVKTGRCKGL